MPRARPKLRTYRSAPSAARESLTEPKGVLVAEQPLTHDQIAASLDAKLKAVEFTEEERSMLQTIFESGLDPDVQGFETEAEKNRKAVLELARSQGGSLGSIPLSMAGGFVKRRA